MCIRDRYHLLQHELNTALGNKWGKGYSHSKLATVYAKEGQYALAKSNMNEALKITRTIGTPYELSGALMRSASLNASIGNSEQAIKDIHESIHLSKIYHQLNSYADGLSELVKIHRNQAYLDSALFYSQLLMTVKDSVLNRTIGKELAELEVKFDTEKKDKEILKLQLEDQLKEARITQQTIIIISSLLGLGLLTLLYFRIKAKNEKIKEQITGKITDKITDKIEDTQQLFQMFEQMLSQVVDPLVADYLKRHIDFYSKVKVKVKTLPHFKGAIPQYESDGASGLDVRAQLQESMVIKPFERVLVPTGLSMEVPIAVSYTHLRAHETVLDLVCRLLLA